MPPRAVIFDFHNTLFHADAWFELETRRLASAVAAYLSWTGHIPPLHDELRAEIDAIYREVRQRVHASGIEMKPVTDIEAILRAVGLKPPGWMIRCALESLEYSCLSTTYPTPGVSGCLQALAQRGIVMAVLSSALYSPFLEWALTRYAVRAFFARVVTSADMGYYKSEPRLFQGLLDALGVSPKDVVHVGDSYRFDIQGARAAGIRAIWVVRGQAVPDPCPADACVTHLASLPAMLEEL